MNYLRVRLQRAKINIKKKDYHIYCFNLSAKRKVLEEYIMYLYIMHVGVYEITMYLLN